MVKEEQLTKLWSDTLSEIKGKVAEPSYRTWFSETDLIGCEGNELLVQTTDDIAKNTLSRNYAEMVSETVRTLTGEYHTVSFLTPEDIQANRQPEDTKDSLLPEREPEVTLTPQELIEKHRLNPKYTFENFVVGKSNQFAHAASLAVAENIAHNLNNPKIYNPLFIYGGSGLGKTHLMQAIAHYVLLEQQQAKIKYVSSETFTNEMIDSMVSTQRHRTAEFRERYRTCDILLVDDIQFLSKKEGTQEEFFHTFNELFDANKQIIIASDRPPREIAKLEERLRTRFEGGIITDVQKPDLETRIAILHKKAQMENKTVPNEVMLYMAENIASNVRELEGTLLSLTTFADLSKQPITVEMAEAVLSKFIQLDKPLMISGELIQEKVCEAYGLRKDELVGRKRSHNIVMPRQIAMYLCREMTDMSLTDVGDLFGGRDHTTVIHAVDKIKELMETDPVLKGSINGIQRDLTGK